MRTASDPTRSQPSHATLAIEHRRAAASGDRDLLWIARENLRKKRLERVDQRWVAALRARLTDQAPPARMRQ